MPYSNQIITNQNLIPEREISETCECISELKVGAHASVPCLRHPPYQIFIRNLVKIASRRVEA